MRRAPKVIDNNLLQQLPVPWDGLSLPFDHLFDGQVPVRVLGIASSLLFLDGNKKISRKERLTTKRHIDTIQP